jgi:hypothetical protein
MSRFLEGSWKVWFYNRFRALLLLFLLLMLMLDLGLEVYGYLASDAGVLALAGCGVCWLALSL